MFRNGEAEKVSSKPTLVCRSYIDDIEFGSNNWDDVCEMQLQQSWLKLFAFLSRITQCNISFSLPKSQFGRRKVETLSHWVSGEAIQAKPKNQPTLLKLRISTSKRGL